MSERTSRILPILALALLFGSVLLVVQPTTAYPVTPSQEAAIDARYQDSQAPYVPYQVRYETNRFYLTSDPTDGNPGGFAQGTPAGGRLTMVAPTETLAAEPSVQPEASAAPDPSDKQFLIATPRGVNIVIGEVANPAAVRATFNLDPVLDDVQVVGLAATLTAACFSNVDPAGQETYGIYVTFTEQKLDETGAWVTDATMGTVAAFPGGDTGGGGGQLVDYSGSTSVGNPILGGQGGNQAGRFIEKGHRVSINIGVAPIGGTLLAPEAACIVHYGSTAFPSNVRTIDNGARLAVFFEDNDGNRLTGLPAGASVEEGERRVYARAIQASPWPEAESQLVAKRVNMRLYDLTAQEYLYYVEDFNDEEPRERDIQEIKLFSRVDSAIGPSVIARNFRFSYPATMTGVELQPELYSLSPNGANAQWDASFPFIKIGGRGIGFGVAPGETRDHQVNPGEPTEFLYRVYNNGTEADLVTVTADEPGSGWTARVLGGGAHFLSPGGSALGTVELVPPANGVAGNSRTVTLHASSSFPDVTDPASITFRSELVSEVRHAVEILATSQDLQVRPGETKGYQVLVANRGTGRDSFVIVPSFPSNIQGWTVVSSPTSLQVPAGALEAVQIRVTAPPEATSGQAFPLGLTVQEVGNAAINDRLDVPVNVFAFEGLLLELFDPLTNRTMRADAPAACVDSVDPSFTCATGATVEDTDFDQSALFRLPLHNLGDRTDSYKVEAFWDKEATAGEIDSATCDDLAILTSTFFAGLVDGVPDGWRFNYEDGVGEIGAIGSGVNQKDSNPVRGIRTYDEFSGYYQLNTTDNPLVVPARTARDIYFELTWLSENFEDPCPENSVGAGEEGFTCGEPGSCDIRSPEAALRVRVTSLNDPARVSEQTLIAKVPLEGTFLGTNRYSAATHNVAIHPATDEVTLKPVVAGAPVVFDVIAVNTGNERDDLKVTVNGASDWTHRLSVVESVPFGKTCELPTDGGATITCLGVGVFEEIHLQVVATPDADVRIGERDPITVTVLSGDAPGIARTLGLVARAAGTLDFDMGALGQTTRSVPVGGTVSFPLFIDNQGTGDDSYRISILRGDVNAWKAAVSTSAPLFVPAGHEIPAFLTVQAPTGGLPGATDVFRVQVESIGSGTKKTVEFSPVVQAASNLLVIGKDGQDVLIPQRNTDVWVNVTAVQTSGTPVSSITFNVDTASLPHGWTVDKTTQSKAATLDSSGRPSATVPFKVKAPADALGTARGLLHVDAVAGALRAGTDINLNLASTYGLDLNVSDVNATKQVVAPGGSAVYNLTLSNLGLGQDTVRMTSTVLPAGWTLLFNPGSATLGPLEERDVEVKISAPVTARPADLASVVVFASSLTDPTQLDSLALVAQVGYHEIDVELVSDVVPTGAPQETVSHVFNVTNNGTLPDEISMAAVLDTLGQTSNVVLQLSESRILLNPGESAQVRLDQTYSATIPSNITLQATLGLRSLLDQRTGDDRAEALLAVTSKVLPYQFADVNGDGLREYAVDRDQSSSDGFEEFRATMTPGGRPLFAADLTQFLRDDVRESLSQDITLSNGTVVRSVVLETDGDGDGKVDHLLDADGDAQPDYYWDPDANKASPIEFRKDVNGDQVPESFIDTNGDGRLDSVYDLTRASFTDVIQVDVDGDGELDYVVDRNGNGRVDQDETVLYTKDGTLLIVQKVDVDGDGRLDQVFDTNGDGTPDYFIPAGSTEAVPIVLRDVNADGTQDWTFDGDGDGRRESYYDPVTGKAHVIDAAGHFGDALRKYWYIGVLFAVVLALFVALVLVTRR